MENFQVRREWLISSKNENIKDFYHFESKNIGEGGHGVVKLATRLQDSARRAVKVIPKKKIKNLIDLNKEIAIMKVIDHPSIVKLYETFENQKKIYLCMELCEGGQLFEKIIEDMYFSEYETFILFNQMVSAIGYLHLNQIVHRDLKPENFVFSKKGIITSLKLIDFGHAASIKYRQKLETKGGTCYYVAPEVLSGNYSYKCDMWSLGVILFMMLSGSAPFDGETEKDILDAVVVSDLNFESEIWNFVSDQAKDLIKHLIDRNPETRYSITDILNHPWLSGFHAPPKPVILDCCKLQSYKESSSLKKTVLNYIATQCNTEELLIIEYLFSSLDVNRDGKLSSLEIQEGLKYYNLGGKDIENIVKCIDIDKSGSIEYNEFIAALMDRNIYMAQEKLKNAFKRFDINNNGLITAEDLKQILGYGSNIQDSCYWNSIIREADLNGDGKIDYEEFVEMMDFGTD
jgi:calcium-dependent protein kinase